MTWEAVRSVATVLAALSSLGAAIAALRTTRHAAKQAALLREQVASGQALRRVEVHARFQAEIRAIQRTFAPDVNGATWEPSDIERRGVSLYWYLVFDEWLVCTQMDPTLAPLWKTQYAEGVKSAFRIPVFREAARKIFEGPSSFFGYGPMFKGELERLCFEATGRPL